MQTTQIHVVNSDVEWFVPSEFIPEELYSAFERARQTSREMDFAALEKQSQLNDVYVLSPTLWRRQFGLELLRIFKIPRDFSRRQSCANNCFELSFWYADKYGKGKPNFLGYGNCYGGTTLFFELGGVQISADEAKRLEALAFLTPPDMRFNRPKEHFLYAEGVKITPKPMKD